MMTASTSSPPLSPVLLAGFAARPMPLLLLQPILKTAMRLMVKNHAAVFDRLSILNNPVFLIDPVDLPFVFILEPSGNSPRLTAQRTGDYIDATATIRGPMSALIELLEGRTDGDALFFSRTLVVEGDTEAVLTLRNAVDGADINLLDDILSHLGPFKRPAAKIHDGIAAVTNRAVQDLEMLRGAMVAPITKRADQQASKIRKMEEKIATLQKENKRLANQVARKSK